MDTLVLSTGKDTRAKQAFKAFKTAGTLAGTPACGIIPFVE
jgi:hypothetical protein